MNKIKDWRFVLLIVAITACTAYYMFVPSKLDSGERDAIIDMINEQRRVRVQALLNASKTKKPASYQLIADAGREYAKEIEIIDVKIRPRGLTFSKKVRIKYTIGGKVSESDNGVRYFRIHHDGMGSSKNDYHVLPISQKRYRSWW